jgi:hypothetical protein
MYCCANCLSDKFLADVIEQGSKSTGRCDYCNSDGSRLINPYELNDVFQQVIDLYKQDSEGDDIVALLIRDWHLFEALNKQQSVALLSEILPEVDFKTTRFSPRIISDFDRIEHWKKFRDELKHVNRFFPKSIPDTDHLEQLFSHLLLHEGEYSKELYRARINDHTTPFDIKDMGKPPKDLITEGRANPVGIPYLYLASDSITAVTELRPPKGEIISVAKFLVEHPLKLADLRNPKKTISPFALSEDGLLQVYSDMAYLCSLGEELTKPVVPRHARLEYLPSQYLCELIKMIGYDGVIYRSSVGDGDNYAVFNDEKLEGIDVEQYEVTDTQIGVKKVEINQRSS